MLTRDSFFAACAELPRESVEIPGIGKVMVKTMTAGERDRFEAEHLKDASRDFRARLAVATICDESGTPLFTTTDIPALSKVAAHHFDPVTDVAIRLNRMGKDGVEEVRKNSGGDAPEA